MDIKMPIMDGMEATKLIKKMSTMPVIAVSASVLDSDRNLFQQAGMDGYVPKPIDKDKIEAILSSRF
jgi:CheY-like chemotaxis protein